MAETFTPEQQALIGVWEAHTAAEFVHGSADMAMETMTDDPVLIHVPVGTGARGWEAVRAFYRDVFIPQSPPDFALEPLTRTLGQNRLVEEFIVRFTHTGRVDWLAPGIEPTGRTLAVPFVAVIAFDNGKIASEHIYWDQATVLAQLGLLGRNLPVLGPEQADLLLDPATALNALTAEPAHP